MSDFLSAALPWIALGMTVAVAVTYMNAARGGKKDP